MVHGTPSKDRENGLFFLFDTFSSFCLSFIITKANHSSKWYRIVALQFSFAILTQYRLKLIRSGSDGVLSRMINTRQKMTHKVNISQVKPVLYLCLHYAFISSKIYYVYLFGNILLYDLSVSLSRNSHCLISISLSLYPYLEPKLSIQKFKLKLFEIHLTFLFHSNNDLS